MELTHLIQMYEICFVYRITQKVSDILWIMFENGWKCILNCVSRFVSVMLNFNALCNAYTVQRHYTELLRSNRIFCLLLGIIFWNCFLTVSNEVEDYLWLYFVYFLNHFSVKISIVGFLLTDMHQFECCTILLMSESVHNL